MATLTAIRAGLAARITAAITDAQCTGYLVPNPTPPFFDIELSADGVDYDEAMVRGLDRWVLTVRGVVGTADIVGAQKNLDDWCASSGATSVKAAIEADRTLGGAVETLQVTRLSGFAPARALNNIVYLGAEWTVEIYARG